MGVRTDNIVYTSLRYLRLIASTMMVCFLVNAANAQQDKDVIALSRANYSVHIDTNTFQLEVQRGESKIPAHPLGNVQFCRASDTSGEAIRSVRIQHLDSDSLTAKLTNRQGQEAQVTIRLEDDYFAISVVPESPPSSVGDLYRIDFRTAALSPAYGLGDHGGFGDNTDVTGFVDDDFGNRDNEHRFISTFTVFPAHEFAQVLFSERTKRVAVSREENRLGVAADTRATVYYFVGNPKQIYRTYMRVRKIEGYPSLKPKYRFFQLGYEAFGSLGWNTYQSSVEEDIDTYLGRGYPIKWAVVGSGFWKGERRNPTEGATTSFGIWDDVADAGRNDGLPNPRYPNPGAFKDFFKKKDISLLLGLRINFKGTTEYGGYYEETNDGEFVKEGMDAGYFVTDSSGKPETYRVNFPQGNVFLLNDRNPAAVDWYVKGANRWGVDGFKEDLMLYDGKKLDNDAKLNPINEALMKRDYLIMARNSAYTVAGDILRLEDTKYGFDQDRPLINGLNYAASGAAAVYLDIVAGKYLENPLTEDQKIYFVRNAMTNAVSPVMAMGHGPWHLQNPVYEKAVKKAMQWHVAYAAYLYSAALESYYTGFPSVMTPLPVAFPDDANTYQLAGKAHRQYAWMLGESLLATPLYGNDYATATQRNVYLPAGRWMDYETKAWFEGPLTLENYDFPLDKIPVFIGGKGILVRECENRFEASVYPTSDEPFSYTFHFPDGERKSVVHKEFANWKKGGYRIRNTKTDEINEVYLSDFSVPLTFEITPGTEYKLDFND
ncbi:TIM-barrel domain-containing protein [Parapedobacter indicus]|uniref:Glycosyl hydrolases family 31 n=1 Tax=Parapedobacter indicus TaxID=1477437 RepID=A0A1I3PKW4_9SPHI|nr:TIM-barrel domain-containing protein [Parapedobacter indicus]PPL00491.1 glycosyl hydrolase family 31 [Parapedobacter indicus]SFJ22145.1 Glycosyl hydrolases family 31 [Parapedobacter indicus]